MKKFKFKYSSIVWVLLAIISCLAIAGCVWNTYSAISYLKFNILKAVSNFIMAGLCLAMLVLVLSVMLYGRYVIKGQVLLVKFGLICYKIDISKITQFVHFKKSNKLVAYYDGDKYTVIVISPSKYEDFILSVRENNKSIIYSSQIDGEDTPL